MIETDKENNSTSFFHYPFVTKSLNTDRYELEVSVIIVCKGMKICSSEKSIIKIIHKGTFAFLKKKPIFLENGNHKYDLNNDIVLTHQVDHFKSSKDGTAGIIIEKALIQINTDKLNKIANASDAHITVGDFKFKIPKVGLENWKLLTDLELASEYLRENQKTNYLAKQKDSQDDKPNQSRGTKAELDTWEMVKKSDQKSDYEFFIDHFPLSKFVIPAKLRISQLE